jgi:hypothetical protein
MCETDALIGGRTGPKRKLCAGHSRPQRNPLGQGVRPPSHARILVSYREIVYEVPRHWSRGSQRQIVIRSARGGSGNEVALRTCRLRAPARISHRWCGGALPLPPEASADVGSEVLALELLRKRPAAV